MLVYTLPFGLGLTVDACPAGSKYGHLSDFTDSHKMGPSAATARVASKARLGPVKIKMAQKHHGISS